jgi:septum formation inhibitor MinC
MKEQLKKLSNLEERRKQLEQQLKQAGMPEEMIRQELAKLAAQKQQLEKLQELAEKLGKCQECMSKGDMEQALKSLEMSKADLQQLMQELQELNMLDEALNDLAEMKNAMVCKNCGGAGCPSCQNQGENGRGFQRGAVGPRDEEEDTTKSFNTRVPQKMRPGGQVEFGGFVQGKQSKGESVIDVQAALESGQAAANDALNRQNIPRDYKKQTKEYFEKVGGTSQP